jgi:hypothetical protein
LLDLNDFGDLARIWSSIYLTCNASLSDIGSLLALTSFGTDGTVTVTDNPALATCAAEEVVRHLTEDLGADPTKFTISGNNDSLTCE